MRVLVTGANGMLGTAIQEVFADHELTALGRELDVRNYWNVRSLYHQIKFDVIIHLAAVTDHYSSEIDWQNTYLTNTIGTFNLVDLARRYGCPIVYISSCSEYDGLEIAKETDILDPINHYAISKYYGDIVVQSWPKHWIIRSGWMMGGGPGIDKKFLTALIWPRIKAGDKEIPAITDSSGNPTYTYDLAKTIKNIIEGNADFGTYNVGDLGAASRYDMAVEFVRLLGIDVKIIPMTAEEFHNKWPAKVIYHHDSVMDLSKIQNSGFNAMRPWKEALRDYVEKSFKNI